MTTGPFPGSTVVRFTVTVPPASASPADRSTRRAADGSAPAVRTVTAGWWASSPTGTATFASVDSGWNLRVAAGALPSVANPPVASGAPEGPTPRPGVAGLGACAGAGTCL